MTQSGINDLNDLSEDLASEMNETATALISEPDKILKMTHYWIPPVLDWEPLRHNCNSSLRIACIAENRLYHGLKFEGNIFPLTPANWKYVLKYAKLDFLLVESAWNTATGHWHMGQCPGSPFRQELLEIISMARKYSIPTVYWITKGHEYHEHYKEFAKHFDLVFCADFLEAKLLDKEGVCAEILEPCVQPALYNPFRAYESHKNFDLNILYDGWADLDRLAGGPEVLKSLLPYGLSIIESRYRVFRNRLNVLPEFRDSILGCVTPYGRIIALKYARAYLTLDQSLSNQTTRKWMALEAAASRVPVLHYGILSDDDTQKDWVIACREKAELMKEIVSFQQDDLYRQRVAHTGWRKVYLKHTFSHRMHKICQEIGIAHDWEEYPKASMITPTYRTDMLPACVDTFERQVYPEKELILVYNGSPAPSARELGLKKQRSDIRIANVAGEMFAGACMNYGHLLAIGEYFFRIDDDDYYGDNYVLDMILMARSIDADLFGKPPVPVCFEGDSKVYVRKIMPQCCILPVSLLAEGKVWIGGNSISGTKRFFQQFGYQDSIYGSADSSLLLRLKEDCKIVCALTDRFNLVAGRRIDQNDHTWKISSDELKHTDFVLPGLDDLIV